MPVNFNLTSSSSTTVTTLQVLPSRNTPTATAVSVGYFASSTSSSTIVFKTYEEYVVTFMALTQGITVTCNRTSSPNAHAATGTISSGDAIYTGDTLQFTVTASSGYYVYEASTRESTSYTETVTVSGDVTKSYHAVTRGQSNGTAKTGTIGISQGGGVYWYQTDTITVNLLTDIITSGTYAPYGFTVTAVNTTVTSVSTRQIQYKMYGTSPSTNVKGGVRYFMMAPSVSPVSEAPYVDDYDTSAPFWMDVCNNNSVTAMLQIMGYLDVGTDSWSESDWVDYFDVPGQDYITVDEQFFGFQNSELVNCDLYFRFKYTSGGTTYYSEEYNFQV